MHDFGSSDPAFNLSKARRTHQPLLSSPSPAPDYTALMESRSSVAQKIILDYLHVSHYTTFIVVNILLKEQARLWSAVA
jgi:hypothetical protein